MSSGEGGHPLKYRASKENSRITPGCALPLPSCPHGTEPEATEDVGRDPAWVAGTATFSTTVLGKSSSCFSLTHSVHPGIIRPCLPRPLSEPLRPAGCTVAPSGTTWGPRARHCSLGLSQSCFFPPQGRAGPSGVSTDTETVLLCNPGWSWTPRGPPAPRGKDYRCET